MEIIINIGKESVNLFLDSAIYVLFGIIIAGLLRVILNPSFIFNHLGGGRFTSVIKAAFLGVPLPL